MVLGPVLGGGMIAFTTRDKVRATYVEQCKETCLGGGDALMCFDGLIALHPSALHRRCTATVSRRDYTVD